MIRVFSIVHLIMGRAPICVALPVCLALAVAAPRSHAADADGFIHGTITLKDGTVHSGFLRWKDEEAFWDDLFASRKLDLVWADHVDLEQLKQEREQRYFAEHGLFDRLIWSATEGDSPIRLRRLFTSRFGDLARIDIPADEDDGVSLTMRDGESFKVRGYANDVDSDILVYGEGAEPGEFAWDELASIVFSPAPAGATPYARRLYGTVTWRGGVLTGFIQWDRSECTTIDVLDSDSEDVPMGRLRSISRDRRDGCHVQLDDGSRLELSGTNDVSRGNRGVMIEVAGLGRVTVPWDRFENAVFVEASGSGPGYAAFSASHPLRGVVTDNDGRRLAGRIVFDADEAADWDIFSGTADECEYDIPFARIRSVEPTGPEACRVVLTDGRSLDLSGQEDTGNGHAGILVFAEGAAEPVQIPWSRLRRLELTP